MKISNTFQTGGSLSQKAVRGGFWVFALKIVGRLFSLARLIIIARVLAPHDFGLMGIALLTMATLETFSQTGFRQALIQKKEKIESYLDSAWTVLILRGFILFTILFFIAPYAAIFFKAPAATLIIRVIGFSILFQAFTNIAVVYFQKELEFHKQFFYQLSGTLADFLVAVPAALILRSVWALVFGLLAASIVRFIVSYLIHPYKPHLTRDWKKAKELFGFGKWILGSSIVVFLFSQGDDIFVGRLLGVTLLGFYQMAYRISNTPTSEISSVFSRVAFPTYSKLQDSLSSLRQAYFKVLKLTTFISVPLAGGIFILAPEFTRIFLTEKWMLIVPAMQVLALAGLLRSIGATNSTIFPGIGKPQINTKWELIRLGVLVALIYPLTIQWGILGTSIVVLLSGLIFTIGESFMAVKITQCGVKNFSKIIALPLISGIVMVLSIIGLKIAVNTVGILQFLLFVTAGISTYLSMSYLSDKFLNYGIFPLIKESLASLRRS